MALQTDGLIGAEFALRLVALAETVGARLSPVLFRCPQCNGPLRPCEDPTPHFQHDPPDPACPLDARNDVPLRPITFPGRK